MALAKTTQMGFSGDVRHGSDRTCIHECPSGGGASSALWPAPDPLPGATDRPLLLRVVGHLPLMDEATDTGGRCPTSLRGGNRGTGSLDGAGRTMGIVALTVVVGSVRLVEFGQGRAIADGNEAARRGSLRSGACWTGTPQRAPLRLQAEPLARRPGSGGKGERQSGAVLDIAAS